MSTARLVHGPELLALKPGVAQVSQAPYCRPALNSPTIPSCTPSASLPPLSRTPLKPLLCCLPACSACRSACLQVTQSPGFLCHIEASAAFRMPARTLFKQVITHPDNAAIFRHMDRCAYRRVLEDDGKGRRKASGAGELGGGGREVKAGGVTAAQVAVGSSGLLLLPATPCATGPRPAAVVASANECHAMPWSALPWFSLPCR